MLFYAKILSQRNISGDILKYEIKKLKLFEPLCYSPTKSHGNESMTRYTTFVGKKDLYPNKADYLTNPIFCGYEDSLGKEQIPCGTYAFVQGFASQSDKLDAAESLWLECVWQEFNPLDEIIYLRELNHGNDVVFQLFRRIEATE